MTADAGKDIEQGEHSSIAGMQPYTTTLEINLTFLRKLGIVLPQDTAIPLLGSYSKDAPPSHKDIYSTMDLHLKKHPIQFRQFRESFFKNTK